LEYLDLSRESPLNFPGHGERLERPKFSGKMETLETLLASFPETFYMLPYLSGDERWWSDV
jgi:hypothetical protein